MFIRADAKSGLHCPRPNTLEGSRVQGRDSSGDVIVFSGDPAQGTKSCDSAKEQETGLETTLA